MKKSLVTLLLTIPLTALAPFSPPAPPPEVKQVKVVSQSDLKQIQCLADNIYHEAKGEPKDGQLAVAFVTMNRVEEPGFPSTVCGVVHERTRGFCQFSWVCGKKKANRETELYREIYDRAKQVYLNYGDMMDITKRSLFFHADYVNPGWNLQKTVKFGRHIFYKQRGNDVQKRS